MYELYWDSGETSGTAETLKDARRIAYNCIALKKGRYIAIWNGDFREGEVRMTRGMRYFRHWSGGAFPLIADGSMTQRPKKRK